MLYPSFGERGRSSTQSNPNDKMTTPLRRGITITCRQWLNARSIRNRSIATFPNLALMESGNSISIIVYNYGTYPTLIFNVNTSSFLNKASHYVIMANSSCQVQGSHLMERKKWIFTTNYNVNWWFRGGSYSVPCWMKSKSQLKLTKIWWCQTLTHSDILRPEEGMNKIFSFHFCGF